MAYMPRLSGQANNHYLVMDYIHGVDLWSHLKQHGALPESEVISLGMKIVRAVAELHRRRIVHLDLKLSNVMRTPDGDVRLIDFGLANHLDLPDLIYESFREPKGTPAYIAPEQFIGVRDEPRSDLFSVGVMLFELATGKLPYPRCLPACSTSSTASSANRSRRATTSRELSRNLKALSKSACMPTRMTAILTWMRCTTHSPPGNPQPAIIGAVGSTPAAASGLAERISSLPRSFAA